MSAPAASEAHVHAWQMTMHVDGCHTYQTAFVCDCGAVRITFTERAFRDRRDPFALVWADLACERCVALIDGARRRPRRDTIHGPGT